MTSKVILSAMGSDRPGLTQKLAEAVLSAGGNWLESHLSRLGGKYVGSVLVELGEERLPALEAAVAAIDAHGLAVSIVAAGDVPAAPGHMVGIELVGHDRPGIVREITAVLAGLQVNIEDFASEVTSSPWSGDPIFRATARLSIPAGTTFEQVRAGLESISAEIMVDLTITDNVGRSAPR